MTRLLSAVALCFLLASSTLPAAENNNSKPPNFVFIFSDDVNRDSWGVYGNPDCKTPNIDQLAKEGMRFDGAYCSVAMCAPFRQELYSGRSPWRTGTLANHSKSTPNTKSLPHYLKPLGYRVGLLGKTHVGPPQAYPFEYINNKAKDNDTYFNAFKSFVDSSTSEKNPFCLFVASHDGHAPHTAGDASQYPPEKLTVAPYWLDTPQLRNGLSKYYAEVTNFDALVGRTRDYLEQQGLLDNTVFVVCSEQGIQFPFAKWTCYDNGLHIGLIVRYPQKVKAGSVAKQLISLSDVAPTFVELAGGKLQAPRCDGKSFVSVLEGSQRAINQYVTGAFTNCNILDNRDRIYPIRSIRDQRYTLIYCPNHESLTSNVTLTGALNVLQNTNVETKDSGNTNVAASWAKQTAENDRAAFLVNRLFHHPEFALYDRQADPLEETNLAQDPKHAETLARLKAALIKHLEEVGDSDPIATEKKLISGKKKKK
ncbi:Choline-sulfatase [Stieleria bergensis]|uniref:Choline-sulfatase n=1 Tax=Stieleria bergensis TaxID=2528025 RepID=A0A517SYK2_9BACT|nr:Choline-sulfatase [Planctomycetes bacterium SV_7m_r]